MSNTSIVKIMYNHKMLILIETQDRLYLHIEDSLKDLKILIIATL